MNNGEEPKDGECSTSLAKVKTSESEVLQHPIWCRYSYGIIVVIAMSVLLRLRLLHC